MICVQPEQAEESPNYDLLPPLVNKIALQGESITLTSCAVHGRPKTDLQWFKNNIELKADGDEERYSITSKGLELGNVTLDDTALYTCRHGHQLQSFSLTIKVAATFQSPEDTHLDILINKTARLHCDAVGEPRPVIHWMKNGQPFRQTHRHILHDNDIVLRGVQRDDKGEYVCQVSNGIGGNKQKCSL